MPKTKDGGYVLYEPEAAMGPYTAKAKSAKKKKPAAKTETKKKK